MYRRIDASALNTMLEQSPGTRVVDVRTDAEVARGRIPGADHIELAKLPSRFEELDANTPVVLYCGSGGRSAQACAFLEQKGFADLYNLEGGINGWVRAGFAAAP